MDNEIACDLVSSVDEDGVPGSGRNTRKSVVGSASRDQGVSFSTSDRATRRVIAPFVNIYRKSEKPKYVEEEINRHLKYYLERKPSILTKKLNKYINDTVELTNLLHETTEILKNTTYATGCILYIVDSNADEMVQTCRLQSGQRHRAAWQITTAKTVAAYVAMHKEFVMVDDVCEDMRFPDGAGWKGPTIKSVLCVPVVTPQNECLAVIELYKESQEPPFTPNDLRIVVVLVGWMGAAIDQNSFRVALQKQQELNDFLLNVTKCYFSDTMILNQIITEMVKFAKSTVGAERGYFFILDRNETELVAEKFEAGIVETNKNEGIRMHKKKQKIRLSNDESVVGMVAKTGEMINLKDAYNDPRFPKEVDLKTQSINRSVLCMPILGIEQILGVIQMVNKQDEPCFTTTDEVLLETFAVYCSLALHHAKVNKEKEQLFYSNQIEASMLDFHMKPCPIEIQFFKENLDIEALPENFDTFGFYVDQEYENVMPQLCLYMLQETIGYQNVAVDRLMGLILMIRKSYRPNQYHNFFHGFTVCHCMYLIVKRNMDLFSVVEREALLIAALCHDIDHQGFTNNFLRIIQDPISDLYQDSPLENHHYNVTMKILGDAQCFVNMDNTVFHQLQSEIHDAILATDLATYFRCHTTLLPLLGTLAFDWLNVNHRQLCKAVMMTSCDLSGMCKPVVIAKKITDNLYREFYHQGDLEKLRSMQPLSMMDRDKQSSIPEDQVQFLTVVVLPCVELLVTLFPNCGELADGCAQMRDSWKTVIEMKDQKVWVSENSYVSNKT